jgi:hypothetical protein
MNRSRSEELFACAQKLIPGGVGGTPPFIARGQGSHIYDVDPVAHALACRVHTRVNAWRSFRFIHGVEKSLDTARRSACATEHP